MKKILLTSLSATLLTHCVTTTPKVPDLQTYRGKTTAERQQAYNENGITPGGLFKPYRVGQDAFPAPALSPLFDAPYTKDETRSKYSAGKTLSIFGTIFGAAGGFMIGWNAGTALRGADTNTGVWIGGGASIVVAFIFGGMADAKYTDASIMYNNDLYEALELRQKTSAVKPQEQFAHYTASMSQAF